MLKINVCHKNWKKLIKSHNCSEHSASIRAISTRYESYSWSISANYLSFTSNLYHSSAPKPSYTSLWRFFRTPWSIANLWYILVRTTFGYVGVEILLLLLLLLLLSISCRIRSRGICAIIPIFAYQNWYPQSISNSPATTPRNENLTKWSLGANATQVALFTSCRSSFFSSELQMCPSYRQVKHKLHSAQRFNTFAHRDTFPLPSQCILYLTTNTLRWVHVFPLD